MEQKYVFIHTVAKKKALGDMTLGKTSVPKLPTD